LNRRVDLRQKRLVSVAIAVDNFARQAPGQYKSSRQSRAPTFDESEQAIFFSVSTTPARAIFLELLTRPFRSAGGAGKSAPSINPENIAGTAAPAADESNVFTPAAGFPTELYPANEGCRSGLADDEDIDVADEGDSGAKTRSDVPNPQLPRMGGGHLKRHQATPVP
jgi:hypothetical protein